MSNQPIGIFDSGVGGISVLKHIHQLLPHEDLRYFADSRHAPYGNKTPEEITARCFAITDFLLQKNVKAIVVACNTATAAAIDAMRAQYPALPIIGMEPAVKPAAKATKTGVVGVLATVGTLKSAQFAGLLAHYGQDIKIITQACVGLVECIERGQLNSQETKSLIRRYCAPLLSEGADTIVLGCTHYPFVKAVIQEIVGKQVKLIDTGAAVARQLQNQLAQHNLFAEKSHLGNVRFWTNNPQTNADMVITQLWGAHADIQHAD